MKKKIVMVMTGIMLTLTACGSQGVSGESAESEVLNEEAAVLDASVSSEETQDDAEDLEDYDEYVEEDIEYVEDTVLSTDLITLTMPDEYKGKYLAYVNGEDISIYDKESNEAGYGGYAFSVHVDLNNDMLQSGMYKKIGELEADGTTYNVCLGYPSDVQWDYTVGTEMPENYASLYNNAETILENVTANNDGVFTYGAGTKGEDLYEDVVAKYVEAVNKGYDEDKFKEEGMSPEFYAVTQLEEGNPLDIIGFTYLDITHDGIDELLVGIIDELEVASTVYDVYSIVDGAPALITSGTLDNKYYALTYGGLANIYTVSEKQYGINVYSLDYGSTKLYRQIAYKYDENENEENPWFVCYGSDDAWEAITQDDYNERIESMDSEYMRLDFTALADF